MVEGPLGEGAMGEVFAAHHRETGWPLAIKVLRVRAGRSASRQQAFAQEVRAAAALHHPGIVPILDYGATDDGRPWMAMARAPCGVLTLDALADWAEVRALLDPILAGLAHAHARQVLHRDLKPSNLLDFGPEEAHRWAIGDFGLARLGEDVFAGQVVGTPDYLPPEQASPGAGPLGPWTDLYALGALAWALVTGRSPLADLPRAAQLSAERPELPPFRPKFPVPGGLLRWLSGLLATDPADRPWRAADARASLLALGPAEGAGHPDASRRAASPSALPTLDPTRDPPEVEAPPLPTPALSPRGGRLRPAVLRAALPGSGVALVGLRQAPLVGRDEELAALLAALERARSERSGQAVWVRAEPGLGADYLLRWLAWTVEERGLGAALRGRAAAGPLAALESALAHFATPEPPSPPIDDLPERWARARYQLARLLKRGPVLLALEGVPADGETWVVLRENLRHLGGPLLLVASSDAPPPPTKAPLRAPELLRLSPLSQGDLASLALHFLPLAPEAVDQLVEAAAGRPARLVAAVAQASAEGLRPGPQGLLLPPGGTSQGEDPLGALQRQHPSLAPALILAGLLGPRIDRAHWARAAALAGVPEPPLAEEALWRAGLATQGRDGLLHLEGARPPVAPEPELAAAAAAALEEGGQDPLRAAALYRAAGRPEATRRALSAAAARHQVRFDAGAMKRVDAALRAELAQDPHQPALQLALAWNALCQREQAGDLAEASRLTEEVLRLGQELGDQKKTYLAKISRASLRRRAGDLLGARAELEALLREGQADGVDPAVSFAAANALGLALGNLGAFSEGRSLAAELRRATQAAGNALAHAWAQHLTGWLHALGGEPEAALPYLEQSQRLAQQSGFRLVAAMVTNDLGEVHRQLGQSELAEAWYSQAVEAFQQLGLPEWLMAEANLILLLVRRGAHATAWARLDAVEGHPSRRELPYLDAVLATLRAELALHRGAEALSVAALRSAQSWLRQSGHAERDFAEAFERIRSAAEAQGAAALAAEAAEAAAQQRAALGG